jgi:pilus assembly protein Flp/PilA
LLGVINRLNIVIFYEYIYNLENLNVIWKLKGKEVNAMLFSPKEKGQGMVEYALIIVLIAIVVIVVLSLLGTQISRVFSQISSALDR